MLLDDEAAPAARPKPPQPVFQDRSDEKLAMPDFSKMNIKGTKRGNVGGSGSSAPSGEGKKFVGDNRLGGWHSYRASKTALNQLTKNCAIEFARKKHPVTFLLLHPGTVETDLSAPFRRNVPEGKLFKAEFSAERLLGIVGDKTQADTGKFFAWDGEEIEW